MAGEMSIDLFQIYYAHSQYSELYPFSRPVYSVGLTPYFENQLITCLVPQSQADYISVCSWRLRQKRGDRVYELGGYGKDALTMEKIEAALPFDVAILTPHSPSHKPLNMAVNWHGKAWVEAFDDFKHFLKQFGKVPEELTYAIYENHFIAKREIYQDYVNSYLIPAIDYIGDKPVYFADANYITKKRDGNEIDRVIRLLSRRDWPIVPFLLERLFSFYIEGKGLNVIRL